MKIRLSLALVAFLAAQPALACDKPGSRMIVLPNSLNLAVVDADQDVGVTVCLLNGGPQSIRLKPKHDKSGFDVPAGQCRSAIGKVPVLENTSGTTATIDYCVFRP